MEQITLVKNAVHRPDEPRHFMEYTYPQADYVAKFGSAVVAKSGAVLKLSEVGHHIYDPVLYFPLADVSMDLLQTSDKSSHCPLKGDTTYYDFTDGDTNVEAIAWCYSAAFDFANVLTNYLAFDGRKVTVSEI
ncbi:MAG: DUF427 domain-containing protein [Gammaproteobacteria bacterium]